MLRKRCFIVLALLLLCILPAAQAQDFDWMRFAGSEITILMNEHPVLDGMRSVLDEFEAETGITVNIEALAENLYFDRMEVALRAEEGVMDVYMVPMDSTAFTQWTNGLIHPLSGYLDDPTMTAPDYDFADFPSGFLQATQYPPGDMDAQDYAIPVSFEAYTLFYNQDIVDEYLGRRAAGYHGGFNRSGADDHRFQRRCGRGRFHAWHSLAYDYGHADRNRAQQLGRCRPDPALQYLV